MYSVFNLYAAWFGRYHAWLRGGKHRANIVFVAPVVVVFMMLAVLPRSALHWCASQIVVQVGIAFVAFCLAPFIVVTWWVSFKNTFR